MRFGVSKTLVKLMTAVLAVLLFEPLAQASTAPSIKKGGTVTVLQVANVWPASREPCSATLSAW